MNGNIALLVFAALLGLVVAVWVYRKRKYDPNNYNLCHFHLLQLSEAFDGRSTCHDGTTWQYIMHGNKCVDSSSALRLSGSTMLRSPFQTNFFPKMLNISKIYLQILYYLRFKAGLENDRFDKKKVFISEKEIDILREHPQFKMLHSGFKFSLVADGENYFTIQTST